MVISMSKKTKQEWEYDDVIETAREKGIVGLNRSTLREIAVSEYVKANTAKNGVVDVDAIAKPLLRIRTEISLTKMREKLSALEKEAKELGVDE